MRRRDLSVDVAGENNRKGEKLDVLSLGIFNLQRRTSEAGTMPIPTVGGVVSIGKGRRDKEERTGESPDSAKVVLRADVDEDQRDDGGSDEAQVDHEVRGANEEEVL